MASCDVEISRIRRFAIDSRVVFAYQLKNISQSNLSMADVSLLSLHENGSMLDFTTAIASQEISLLELNSPSGQNNPLSIESLIAKLISSDKKAKERSETKNSFLPPNGTAWMVQVIKLPNHSVGKVHSWIQTPNTKLKLSDFSTSGKLTLLAYQLEVSTDSGHLHITHEINIRCLVFAICLI